ncbi:MAG TPA: hypothetical protein VGO80_10150 [Solirubrobacteraceae bacterium]|nr:hypothetical protein [Solirubrobacteraceae bacterium]
MSAALIAAGCLAVAGGWRASLVEADIRRLDRAGAGGRAYRPELGWTDAALLTLRRRWAWAGLVASGGIVASLAVPSARAIVWPLCAITIAIWVCRDARLHHGRYTSVCIGTLAAGVALASVSVDAGGLLGCVAASQLYLVAGIRKLRSRAFMSGRVLLDNVVYGACQAAAGNGEFLRCVSTKRLAAELERGALLRACRVASIATAASELAVGAAAIGLTPAWLMFAIAIPMHLGFTLLSPKRLIPFTFASLGLLSLATVHPLLDVW